jgi:hypothetical protein
MSTQTIHDIVEADGDIDVVQIYKTLYRVLEGSCSVEISKIIDTSDLILPCVQRLVNSEAINYDMSTFLGLQALRRIFRITKISFHPTTHAQISSEFLRADSSQTLCS